MIDEGDDDDDDDDDDGGGDGCVLSLKVIMIVNDE